MNRIISEELTDGQIHSTCMSYRHDYGIMPEHEQARLRLDCRMWHEAFVKNAPTALDVSGVSRHDLDVWFYGNEGKPDPFGSGRQLFSMEKGLDAIFEHLEALRTQPQAPDIDAIVAFRIIENHPEATQYIVETAKGGRRALGGGDDSSSVSPRVAVIRKAKDVIRAMGLPNGGGVALNLFGTWQLYSEKPVAGSSWDSPGRSWLLPKTAIPPYPGDWEDSWITLDTSEEG